MDTTVYSNDRRVEVVQKEGQNGTSKRNNKRANSDWILHIHQAHPSDSGIYECQINTEPKKSKAYHLQIVGKYSLYTLYWHFLGSKICKSTKHFCTILPHFLYIFNLMDGHIEFRFVPVYFHIYLPYFFFYLFPELDPVFSWFVKHNKKSLRGWLCKDSIAKKRRDRL